MKKLFFQTNNFVYLNEEPKEGPKDSSEKPEKRIEKAINSLEKAVNQVTLKLDLSTKTIKNSTGNPEIHLTDSSGIEYFVIEFDTKGETVILSEIADGKETAKHESKNISFTLSQLAETKTGQNLQLSNLAKKTGYRILLVLMFLLISAVMISILYYLLYNNHFLLHRALNIP